MKHSIVDDGKVMEVWIEMKRFDQLKKIDLVMVDKSVWKV
jgi:hypothetical protein